MLCCEKFWFCTMNKKTIMFCNCLVHKREREREKKLKVFHPRKTVFSSAQENENICQKLVNYLLCKQKASTEFAAPGKIRKPCIDVDSSTFVASQLHLHTLILYSFFLWILYASIENIFFIQTTKTKKT